MSKTNLVISTNNQAYTKAQAYLDEISLMCEIYCELTDDDDFNHGNFDSTIISAISSLAALSIAPEVIHNRMLFCKLKSKIYEWYCLVLHDDDESTDEFKEGVGLTLSAISINYIA